jgi:hypothetical protein
MVLDTKDWDIICETLKEFQQKLKDKIEAYSSIYAEESYPIEIQHDAVWIKDVCESAQKLMQLQKDFIDMIKKGPSPV